MAKVPAKKATTASAAVKPSKASTILDIWGKSDDTKKNDKVHLQFKMLQARGNQDLINKSVKVAEAEEEVSNAKQSALKDPDFTKIASAELNLEAAQLELNRAKSTFVSLFGEAPSL